jgi:hypothetical protein
MINTPTIVATVDAALAAAIAVLVLQTTGAPTAAMVAGGVVAFLAAAMASRLRADAGGPLERIPSPLTLASDLGKRRCAQR